MDVRIEQLEQELAQKLVSPLRSTLPGQDQLRVSLLDSNGRKKRSNASANNWSPDPAGLKFASSPPQG